MLSGLAIGACLVASLWLTTECWFTHQKRKADERWLAAIQSVKPKKAKRKR